MREPKRHAAHRQRAGDLADQLTAWRRRRGLTQQQLAQASGTTRGMVSSLESGKRLPSAPLLYAILDALHLDLLLIEPADAYRGYANAHSGKAVPLRRLVLSAASDRPPPDHADTESP